MDMNPLLLARSGLAMVRLVRDLSKLEEIFALADAVDSGPLSEAWMRLLQEPEIAPVARSRHRIGRLDLDQLAGYPEGSFGREVALYLRQRGLNPADLPAREAKDDLSWVGAHIYETHDIWHVVTGFDTDPAGELGLQAFYAAQIPDTFPIAILCAGFLNTLIYQMDQKDNRLAAISRGYAMGKRAKCLFGVRWDALWRTPLAEVRRSFRIDLPAEGAPAREALAA